MVNILRRLPKVLARGVNTKRKLFALRGNVLVPDDWTGVFFFLSLSRGHNNDKFHLLGLQPANKVK